MFQPTRRICYYTVTCLNDRRHSSKIPLFNDFVAVSWFLLRKIVLQANRTLTSQVLRSNPLHADFKLQWLSATLNDGLLAEWYERCELETQNPLSMTAVINFSRWWISRNYRPANVGVPHLNQRNFFEHSEEPYNTIPSTIFKHITCICMWTYLYQIP